MYKISYMNEKQHSKCWLHYSNGCNNNIRLSCSYSNHRKTYYTISYGLLSRCDNNYWAALELCGVNVAYVDFTN
ncbi:MAG: hypothetical protein ACKPKO_35440, partial [Candidatus Fonsibacter sp.]